MQEREKERETGTVWERGKATERERELTKDRQAESVGEIEI